MLTLAVQAFEFCNDTAPVWKLVGNILFIFKIVIPILLIIFGMMDLGKAVVGAKDDEIKKSVKSLAMRAIAAIFIFLIPVLVSFIVKIIDGFDDVQGDYDICRTCITHPGQCPNS